MISIDFVILALVAYLLGSIPFGYILVKLFLKQDIRQTGSGNIGATNVARSGRKGLAVTTLLLDAGKGALAVWAIDAWWNGTVYVIRPYPCLPDLVPPATAAFFAILGHCFPIWLKFKGGKGVATAIGAFSVLAPSAAIGTLICFALVFAASRYVSLASIISAAVFPFLIRGLSTPNRTALLVLCSASSLVIILKHHANIRRLIAGTEPKFGAKAIGTTDPIQTEKNV